MSAGGFSMFGLFQQEVEAHGSALNDGLLKIEAEGADRETLDALMRAAHSLKGAARIIGFTAFGELAHAMEDRLQEARDGKRELEKEHIDPLLRAADLLQGVVALPDESAQGAWEAENGPRIDELKQAIQSGETLEATQETSTESEPATEESAAPSEVAAPPAKSQAATAELPGQSVRVAADALNRLMGLAAEALVETRRLEPMRAELISLKNHHQHLVRKVEAALDGINGTVDGGGAAELLVSARADALAVQRAIRGHLESVDAYMRRNTFLSDRLYREVLATRMRPFEEGVRGFPRLVRDLARSLGKNIRLAIDGKSTPVDRDILERLEAPLNHIIRNACDHGIENPDTRKAAGKPDKATVRIHARHVAGMLLLEVTDDGHGISVDRIRQKAMEKKLVSGSMSESLGRDEILEFLFLPGFSTATEVTDVSGRGVGLDVVQSLVRELGGSVRIETEDGQGTSFFLQLPITRSVLRALIVEIDGEPYALPLSRIQRTLALEPGQIKTIEGRQYFEHEGANVGLVSAREALGLIEQDNSGGEIVRVVVVADRTGTSYGLEIAEFHGEQDLVVRPLDSRFGKVPGVNSSAVLEDGSPVLILDIEDLISSIEKLLAGGRVLVSRRRADEVETATVKRVLVVDDSITVRETERQLLENAGYEVETAVDGADGWNVVRIQDFDLVVSDVDMPRMNGFEFVRKIRGDSRLSNLPVVIVSYKDREEDRMEGMEAGADAYLTKSSFQDDTFVSTVNDLIGELDSE